MNHLVLKSYFGLVFYYLTVTLFVCISFAMTFTGPSGRIRYQLDGDVSLWNDGERNNLDVVINNDTCTISFYYDVKSKSIIIYNCKGLGKRDSRNSMLGSLNIIQLFQVVNTFETEILKPNHVEYRLDLINLAAYYYAERILPRYKWVIIGILFLLTVWYVWKLIVPCHLSGESLNAFWAITLMMSMIASIFLISRTTITLIEAF